VSRRSTVEGRPQSSGLPSSLSQGSNVSA
jgi:hypothetical protein